MAGHVVDETAEFALPLSRRPVASDIGQLEVMQRFDRASSRRVIRVTPFTEDALGEPTVWWLLDETVAGIVDVGDPRR